MAAPELDRWLSRSAIRVVHQRRSSAAPERLWAAAQGVTLQEAALLGRLIRWRIPGTPLSITFDELFRSPPFIVLHEDERTLVSGLVGKIWTLRRDYPHLTTPGEYRNFSERGTARVLFAHWVDAAADDTAPTLFSETRVEPIGAQGRVGLTAVRPLVRGFQHLIGSDGIAAAVRHAERAEAAHPVSQST